MRKKTLLIVVSSLMLLSMVTTACGQATVGTSSTTSTISNTSPAGPATSTEAAKPTGEEPKYGGTLNLVQSADVVNWEPIRNFGGAVTGLEQEPLMGGDWAKGPAGGYGTDQTDWGSANNDLVQLKTGYLATQETWSVNAANDTATVVFDIRQGIHWALNPNSEASKLVGGREMTADDVVATFKRETTWPLAGLYMFRPEFHDAVITKTGPWQVSVTIKGVNNLYTLIQRLADMAWIEPPEVIQKYGDMNAWDRQEGTGPFMVTDYVQGSAVDYQRNPDYWMKDPIGPGKGNQLPYLNAVNVLVIPDSSTQYAALRTGKIDEIANLSRDDALSILKTSPKLVSKSAASNAGMSQPLVMRMDKPGLPWGPQGDPKALEVRQAMMMAIDFQGILNNYFDGQGQIVTWPQAYVKDYAGLYASLDDLSESAKELYSYDPDKAKQLLTEAGYPDGFKCSMVTQQSEVDYYSIIKGYWSKVGIDLSFDIKDPTTRSNILYSKSYPEMITDYTGPTASWYTNDQMWGTNWANGSCIDDPTINQGIAKALAYEPSNDAQAEAAYKQLAIYVQDKAYVIPQVIGYNYYLWWPWLKNYSGEQNIGFGHYSWPQFIWYDHALKQEMGY